MLDEPLGASQERVLLISPEGDVGILGLQFNFDEDTVFSDLFLGNCPEKTYMEKSVNKETGTVKVGLLNGRENGFDGEEIQLRLKYTILHKDNPVRPPLNADAIKVLKALNMKFEDKTATISLRWLEP